jgi:hypothetical protein
MGLRPCNTPASLLLSLRFGIHAIPVFRCGVDEVFVSLVITWRLSVVIYSRFGATLKTESDMFYRNGCNDPEYRSAGHIEFGRRANKSVDSMGINECLNGLHHGKEFLALM